MAILSPGPHATEESQPVVQFLHQNLQARYLLDHPPFVDQPVVHRAVALLDLLPMLVKLLDQLLATLVDAAEKLLRTLKDRHGTPGLMTLTVEAGLRIK